MFSKDTQSESFLEPARCVTGQSLYQIRSLGYSPQAEAFASAVCLAIKNHSYALGDSWKLLKITVNRAKLQLEKIGLSADISGFPRGLGLCGCLIYILPFIKTTQSYSKEDHFPVKQK